MRSRNLLRRALGGRLRTFVRDGDGATAVEFALISMVFVPLLCAIIEMAMVFWAGQVLDTSLATATRSLYTGTFQSQSQNSDTSTPDKTQAVLTNLRNLMCYPNGDNKAVPLTTIFDCNSVKIDVLVFSQFSGAAAGNPVDPSTGDLDPKFGTRYTKPQSGDIVIVQAVVKFPIFFAFMMPTDGAKLGNKRLLRATVAFRTEPY